MNKPEFHVPPLPTPATAGQRLEVYADEEIDDLLSQIGAGVLMRGRKDVLFAYELVVPTEDLASTLAVLT